MFRNGALEPGLRRILDARSLQTRVGLAIDLENYLSGHRPKTAPPPRAQIEALCEMDLRNMGGTCSVVDHSLAHNSAIRVIVSLYDYPNFVDTIDVIDPLGCRDRWNDLDQPTPQQINEAMIELQNRAEVMISSRPRARLVSHLGLMQYLHDGLPPPGDPTLPSPLEAMLFGEDCIHLSPDGYLAVAQNLWNGFYYSHFGGLFADGFESGDTTAWSSTQP